MSDNCAAITVDEQLKCAICLDTWRHPVEVLPCRHIFCRPCISTVSQCPMCRSAIRGAQYPSGPLVCLSDAVKVECTECHWKGTREQSYSHRCHGTSAPAPRSAAVPAHVDPTPSAPRLQEQALNPLLLSPSVVTASGSQLVSAATVASRTVDFSDQQQRVNLSELDSQPGALRVVAKNCVSLTELTALVACKRLVEVNFAGCKNLCDTQHLRWLSCLRAVNLSATSVRSISFAARCLALDHVDLSGLKPLRDLSPLKKCRRLRELYIRNTSVANLAVLRGMVFLTILDATRCTKLTSISPLQECRKLQELRVRRTPVAEFGALSKKRDLSTIDLGGCPHLTDLSAIRTCWYLSELYIDNTPVASLGPLCMLHDLKLLDATGCAKLQEISALRGCCALKELHVGGTSVTDLSVLRGMRYLETVCASNSRVSRVDGLDTCPKLTTLRLDGTPRSDYNLPIRHAFLS